MVEVGATLRHNFLNKGRDNMNSKVDKKKARLKRYLPLYLMLIPGSVYLIINNYIPMAGLLIAFKKIDYSVGILKSPWVGLSNFRYLFSIISSTT